MNGRKLVAFATNEIVGNYHQPLYSQVVTKARTMGSDLLVFEGCQYGSPSLHEREANLVFDFMKPPYIDLVLVSAGSLFNEGGAGCLDEFISLHRDLSLVLLGGKGEGIPSVTLDNTPGVFSLCRHLYETHGEREFSFVTGPPDNGDSRERLGAFLSFMEKKGLARDEKTVLEGNFRSEAGRNVMR